MDSNKWIGKSISRRDTMAPEQLRRFEAMVNRRPDTISEGDELHNVFSLGIFHSFASAVRFNCSGIPP
ncbi:hypothetical protein [Rhodohalobacter sp.]|uniref:hypothetical protein n=1 Tax=Rhodohalobacter sp. TaxID=1974210 RepID=UPI002ACD9A7F|nr:hypothetical protein [Rhodohalobacter sp.]MDZ7757235.1 hypothetical protein [Rhodohalobacter sp.]